MIRYRMICPDCGAVVTTATRLTAVLEVCPSCRHHVWDVYDALLADVYCTKEPGKVIAPSMTA